MSPARLVLSDLNKAWPRFSDCPEVPSPTCCAGTENTRALSKDGPRLSALHLIRTFDIGMNLR